MQKNRKVIPVNSQKTEKVRTGNTKRRYVPRLGITLNQKPLLLTSQVLKCYRMGLAVNNRPWRNNFPLQSAPYTIEKAVRLVTENPVHETMKRTSSKKKSFTAKNNKKLYKCWKRFLGERLQKFRAGRLLLCYTMETPQRKAFSQKENWKNRDDIRNLHAPHNFDGTYTLSGSISKAFILPVHL